MPMSVSLADRQATPPLVRLGPLELQATAGSQRYQR